MSTTRAPVIRFRMPPGSSTFTDLVRGEVTFDHALISDFALTRSDGHPLYMLASSVDDVLMKITHIIRGEDLLSSVPRQLALYAALAVAAEDMPRFAHLPLITGDDGRPLSKRNGEVSIAYYRREGFLPEAMVNYLALLGWSPGGDVELFSLDEMVASFDLELLDVEARRVLRDPLEVEAGHHLVQAEQLHIVPRRPAEQRQVVHHGLRQEPFAPVVGDRNLAVALGQRPAVVSGDQRQVPEPRHVIGGYGQRGVQGQLPRHGGQQVLAPDDVRDLHQYVVDRGREHVQRVAVTAGQGEVGDQRMVERDLTTHQVGECRRPGRHPEPDRRRRALRAVGGGLGRTQRPAVPVVPGRPVVATGLLGAGIQLRPTAEAGVYRALLHQLGHHARIDP